MANTLILKRSATPGKVPTTANLALGELGINTYDGKLYLKKDNGSQSIVEVGPLVAPTWGSIGGTLSNQTDLQNALNAKADLVSANFTTLQRSTLNVVTSTDGAPNCTRGTAAPSGGNNGDIYFQYT